jgi:hypothetical protein
MFWTEKVLERYVAASWNRNIIIYKWLHWEKHDENKIILTDFKWSKGCQSTEKWESCIIDPFCLYFLQDSFSYRTEFLLI